MPPRTPKQLLDQAAEVRGRAEILHKAADLEKVRWENKRDDARRDVRVAQREAKVAESEAQDLYDDGQTYSKWAADAQVAGQRLASSRPLEAEEHLETAQEHLRAAESAYARADAARQRYREQTLKAEEAVKRVEALDEPPFPPNEIRTLEIAADQLDENARYLTSAADHLRQADAARAVGDFAGAQAHEIQATAAVDQAVEVSLRDVDPEVLRRYGYPVAQAQAPATDDPTALADNFVDDPVLGATDMAADVEAGVDADDADDQVLAVATTEDTPMRGDDVVMADVVAVSDVADFTDLTDDSGSAELPMNDMDMEEDFS